jgi:hypothetical protein
MGVLASEELPLQELSLGYSCHHDEDEQRQDGIEDATYARGFYSTGCRAFEPKIKASACCIGSGLNTEHQSRRKGMLSCYPTVVGNKIECMYALIPMYLVTYDRQITRYQSFTLRLALILLPMPAPVSALLEPARVGFQLWIYRNQSDPHRFEL